MNWRKPAKGLVYIINELFRIVVISFIRVYQLILSPYVGRSCRFSPTCSQYALDSFNSYNFFKALYLTIKRLLKCHPFGPYGYDPVPQSKPLKEAHK